MTKFDAKVIIHQWENNNLSLLLWKQYNTSWKNIHYWEKFHLDVINILLNHFVSIFLDINKWELQWVVVEFQGLMDSKSIVICHYTQFCPTSWHIVINVVSVIMIVRHSKQRKNDLNNKLIGFGLIGRTSIQTMEPSFWVICTFAGRGASLGKFLGFLNLRWNRSICNQYFDKPLWQYLPRRINESCNELLLSFKAWSPNQQLYNVIHSFAVLADILLSM